MKAGQRIVTAVAVGYVLGRTHKMKLAIAIAGMMAGRRLATNPREFLQQGVERIASSPQLSRLSGEMRDQLLEAIKAAALAAASNKIESLGDSLSKRAEGLRAGQSMTPGGRDDEQRESVPRQREAEQRQEAGRGGAAGERRPRSSEQRQSRSQRGTGTSATSTQQKSTRQGRR